MQPEYQSALARMVHRSYMNNDVDPLFSDRMLRLAHVIWAVWEDDEEVVHARVILGRDLDSPDLVHVAYVVQDEDEAVREQETLGDPIETDGNGILQAPEPPVPDHMHRLLIQVFGTEAGGA
jgi:hypothetical protein